MADEVLMYAVAFTGLFGEGLKDVATPTFHAELKKLGVDLAKPLPGYPYALWESAIELGLVFPSRFNRLSM